MSLDQDIERLARIPILNVLGHDALRLLAFSGETRILRTGDVLFRQGEGADGAFFVLSGALSLDDGSRTGGPAPKMRAGVLLGETALIRACDRPATAIAAETTTVLRIPRALFHRVLSEHPEAARRVHAFLLQRIQAVFGDGGDFADPTPPVSQ